MLDYYRLQHFVDTPSPTVTNVTIDVRIEINLVS